MKLRSYKSSVCINKKGYVSYRGFGYLSLFSDPTDLAKGHYCNFATFKKDSRYKDHYNPNRAKYSKDWLEKDSKSIIIV